MSINVQSFFTLINGADASTGWTSSGVGVFTGFQREDTACLGNQASLGFEDPYFTLASIEDYSDRTIFGWQRSGNPDTTINDGFGMIVGDRRRQLDSVSINNVGAGYSTADELTIVGGTFLVVATVSVQEVSTIQGQDQSNYDGAGSNGTFAGGTGHAVNDVITLSDGSTITVDAISGGVVTQFTVTTNSTTGFSDAATLTQSSTTGAGISFSLSPGTANQELETINVSTSGNYGVDPATPNTPTGGTGSGAILNLTMADGAVSTRTSFTVGGGDFFGHFVLGWSSFRLDVANLQVILRDLVGTAANLYTNRIQDVGYSMNYQTKALGNADNVFWDQLTYITNGTPALRILGGTSGSPGTFGLLVSVDISTSFGSFGVIRVLAGKAFELFFGVEFGHATSNSFFEDRDFQLFINGGAPGLSVMSAGNMDVNLLAGSGTNLFILEDGVIVGLGTRSNWDLSAAFETMQFNRLVVSNLGTITFPVTGGTLREANDNVFNNCDQIYLSSITGNNNTFNDTNNPLGAILWDADSVEENQDNLTFISGGSGHAIQISLNTASLTTFNIDGYVVSGYETANDGSTGNTVLIVDNLLDGDVTINVSGGSGTISFERAAGYTGTVTINANVTVTLTGLQNNTEVTVFDSGTGAEIAHVEDVVGNEFAFSDAASNVVDIFIHHIAFYRADLLNFTIPGVAASIPIKQTSDPNYVND